MKKSIKCGITAAVVAVASYVAYQSYGSYGVQDNSLLMQNIEALASGTDPNTGDTGDGGSNTNLPAHECYTYGSQNPGSGPLANSHGYICSSQNFEFTKDSAVKNQTKCSYYGYRRMGGYGDDHKHWCVYKNQ